MKRSLFSLLTTSSLLFGAGGEFDIWLSDSVILGNSVESNREFMSYVGSSRERLRGSFKNSFKRFFSNAVEKIDPKKRRGTSAAFLSIVRASKYELSLEGSSVVTYILPVTATINFVNISTGELLYSEAYTHITPIELSKTEADLEQKIVAAYAKTTDELIAELADKASKKFIPKKSSAKVVAKEKGILVLDKGLADGIVDGSLDGENGSLIKVIYSAKDYSIAKEELGGAKVGDSFTKVYSSSLEDIKKPKITLLDIKYDTQKLHISENMLYQFAAEKLAQKGSFLLMSINKNFYTALNSLKDSANLGIRLGKRASPEYFLRLYIDGPYSYDIPTNVDYAKTRVYQALICGEVVDQSGRVVSSDCHNEELKEDIKFSKAYSKEAGFEMVAKNAAITIAEKLGNSVSFEPISYKILSVKDGLIEIDDSKNLLSEGSPITIYADFGSLGGKKQIFVPIMETSVEKKEGSKVIARETIPKFSGAPTPKEGDSVLEELIKTSEESSKLFKMCDRASKIGDETIDGFEEMARFIVPKYLKYPFYSSKSLQDIVTKRISAEEFEKVPTVKDIKSSYCIAPLYRYKQLLQAPSSEYKGFTQIEFDAVVGVKEFFGLEERSKFGLGGKVSEFAPAGFVEEYKHIKLLQHATENLAKSVEKLEIK